jgi:hypothetical protein
MISRFEQPWAVRRAHLGRDVRDRAGAAAFDEPAPALRGEGTIAVRHRHGRRLVMARSVSTRSRPMALTVIIAIVRVCRLLWTAVR